MCNVFKKVDGQLHYIDKGNTPFETIHIDHYGPLNLNNSKFKFIFGIVDGFTKYIKLYPCKTTNTSEVLKHLRNYCSNYSIPTKLVSDRGSCFTANSFKTFMNDSNIKHVLIASGCPKSNGQLKDSIELLHRL